jgi:4'-phosphopantetheinyl transferase
VALAGTRQWRPWLPVASRLLDSEEVGRVQSRRIAADRELLTLAYGLHRAMLGAVLGLHPREVPLYRDARGCPRLVGGIAATSLSHAGGAIGLAVAVGQASAGVDIEPITRLAAMDEVATRICHPVELGPIEAMGARDRALALLALWVRKEAVLKAAGVGFAIEPDSFALSPGEPVRIQGCSEAYASRSLASGHRWMAAVAGSPAAEVEYGWTGPGGVLRFHEGKLAAAQNTAAPIGAAEWMA